MAWFVRMRNAQGNTACAPQAIIMIVVMMFTTPFRNLLNKSFGLLLEHLQITLADDAVLWDGAF